MLIAIARGEADATAWIDVLAAALEEGDLVICDAVAAEVFAVPLDADRFRETLAALGIAFSPTLLDSAQLAGSPLKQHRRDGGPGEHLIPEFLVAAHAQTQADALAAIDRGYLRRYFPRLRVLTPGPA